MFYWDDTVTIGRYKVSWHEGCFFITRKDIYNQYGGEVPPQFIYESSYANANYEEAVIDLIKECDEIAKEKSQPNDSYDEYVGDEYVIDLMKYAGVYDEGIDTYYYHFTEEEYYDIIDFCVWSSKHQDEIDPAHWISKRKRNNRNTENPDYPKWRNKVIQRDGKCVCCGLDKHLEAHHMFGYKENPLLATNENNGVTLCKFCHKKYHSIYGLKNITPVDFMDFIKNYGVK